jgi:hypothetical protein
MLAVVRRRRDGRVEEFMALARAALTPRATGP